MTCDRIHLIQASSQTGAAVCALLAPGLEKLGYSLCGLVVAALGAGAVSLNAYLSSSPKDSPTVTQAP